MWVDRERQELVGSNRTNQSGPVVVMIRPIYLGESMACVAQCTRRDVIMYNCRAGLGAGLRASQYTEA